MEDLHQKYDLESMDYDDACDIIIKSNEKIILEFWNHLKSKGLSYKTIQTHVDNVDFYVDTFLLRYDLLTLEHGTDADQLDDFFSYFFIRKCMWSSPKTIRSNATSFKKFYKFLAQRGDIEPQRYIDLTITIKTKMSEWLDEYQRYSDYCQKMFDQERQRMFSKLFGSDMTVDKENNYAA